MQNYDLRQSFDTTNVKVGERIKKVPFGKKRASRVGKKDWLDMLLILLTKNLNILLVSISKHVLSQIQTFNRIIPPSGLKLDVVRGLTGRKAQLTQSIN